MLCATPTLRAKSVGEMPESIANTSLPSAGGKPNNWVSTARSDVNRSTGSDTKTRIAGASFCYLSIDPA